MGNRAAVDMKRSPWIEMVEPSFMCDIVDLQEGCSEKQKVVLSFKERASRGVDPSRVGHVPLHPMIFITEALPFPEADPKKT